MGQEMPWPLRLLLRASRVWRFVSWRKSWGAWVAGLRRQQQPADNSRTRRNTPGLTKRHCQTGGSDEADRRADRADQEQVRTDPSQQTWKDWKEDEVKAVLWESQGPQDALRLHLSRAHINVSLYTRQFQSNISTLVLNALLTVCHFIFCWCWLNGVLPFNEQWTFSWERTSDFIFPLFSSKFVLYDLFCFAFSMSLL